MNSVQSEQRGEGALAADVTLVTVPPPDPPTAPHVSQAPRPGPSLLCCQHFGVLEVVFPQHLLRGVFPAESTGIWWENVRTSWSLQEVRINGTGTIGQFLLEAVGAFPERGRDSEMLSG